jgi:hypothetical protein
VIIRTVGVGAIRPLVALLARFRTIRDLVALLLAVEANRYLLF